jgi:hypothetical protein
MAYNRNAELRKLQRAYSNAMWTWAEIEADLFQIFAHATDSRHHNYETLRETFFAINGFRMRLDMTHAAAKLTWAKHEDFLKVWLHLHEECSEQARKRGKIAHLSGRELIPKKPNESPIVILGEPMSKLGMKVTHATARSRGYTAKDLDALNKTWRVLEAKLARFGFLVSRSWRILGGLEQPSADLIRHLQSLVGPISVKRLRLRQSSLS